MDMVKGRLSILAQFRLAATAMRRLFACLLACGLVVSFASTARSQQPPTRAADPARIDERLRTPPPPSGGEATPPVPQVVPRSTPDERLVLAGVVIDGATVFAAADFAPLYEPLLGRTVDRNEIGRLVEAITAKYREAGYILSRAYAPAQDAALGLLRIEVLEGYVDRVAFEGEPGGGRAQLEAYAERIRAERPLTLATLERYLLLISDLPGMSVRSGIAPVDPLSPAHELLLRIARDPAEGYLALDNHSTRTIGPNILQAAARLNSPLGLNESLTLRTFTVPESTEELRFGQVRAQLPVGTDGATVAVDLWRSQIEAGGQLEPFDVESMEKRAALELAYPWLRSRALSLYVNAQFEYRDTEQDALGFPLFDDEIRSLRLGIFAYVADGWGGATTVTATVSQGLDVLSASRPGDPLLSRFDGDPQYTKLSAELIREQEVAGPLSAQIALAGQMTGDRMLSSEEFRLGGGLYGRAYDPSELVGDEGAAAAIELRYDLASPIDAVSGLQLFGFYDVGAVWDDIAGLGTQRFSLASAGFGVRFTLLEQLAVTLEVANPLTRDVFEEGDDNWRAFFATSFQF